MRERGFHVASDQEIRQGSTTDVYFERTVEILKAADASRRVKAEFSLKGLPPRYTWGIAAGIEECCALLEGRPLSVRVVREGTPVQLDEPIMVIEGDYAEFAVLETPLLGLLCQASGIATKAARLRIAAGERMLISFGARRMHPAISPMIERNAFVGGCDGVATVKASALLGIEASGTIPHALVILCGGIDGALEAFDRFIAKRVKRIALVDTFGDEKFEAIAACRTLGKRLYGIRLDTPRSRRGNMRDIVREVRWELDLRGYRHVKILASGGLDEIELLELRDVVDGFGIGTCLSDARVLDYAMDIVEVEDEPTSKRGKMSGEKNLLRCRRCHRDYLTPAKGRSRKRCKCGGQFESLLNAHIKDGRIIRRSESPTQIRKRVLKSLDWLEL
jgi:nicotinate phosphoribosyltransferase